MLTADYEVVLADGAVARRWRFKIGFQDADADHQGFNTGCYYPEDALLEMAHRADGSRNVRTDDGFVVFETPDMPLRVPAPPVAEEAHDG